MTSSTLRKILNNGMISLFRGIKLTFYKVSAARLALASDARLEINIVDRISDHLYFLPDDSGVDSPSRKGGLRPLCWQSSPRNTTKVVQPSSPSSTIKGQIHRI
jgi:hypothetical protein